jgi:hypothetical protein
MLEYYGNNHTYLLGGGGSSVGVTTFEGRSGVVTAQESDYSSFYNEKFDAVVVVKQPSDLAGVLDSSKVYFIDGIIDFTGTGISIEIPAGGLAFRGHNFDISKLICSDNSYTLFTSPVGGSGNLIGTDYALEVTGTSSQVYNIVSATGFEAFEFSRINYNNCTSLGTIDNYRQGFETGSGRFGGTPNLTLSGVWLGGFFIDACIVRSLDAGMAGALFQAGTGFQMNSRFRSNMNTDLPALAAYADFTPAQFPNPSTVQMTGAIITRDGVQDASDSNIFPNMTQADLSSAWSGNVGIPNTHVGGKIVNTLESATTIVTQSVPVDIAGASLPSQLEHFDSPSAFQLRHLGNNPLDYTLFFDAVIDGPSNAEVELYFQKWDDSASAFVEVGSQRRQVNAFVGSRDVAFFNGQFTLELAKNDYVKWQVANNTNTSALTVELDSFFVVTER